jgi:hypothetical protein
MNTLFRAVKASETKPPREDKIINAIYEGIPRSVRCFKNNTALWCAEIDDWIYDWQFPELEYFVPIEETEATAGMRERVKDVAIKYERWIAGFENSIQAKRHFSVGSNDELFEIFKIEILNNNPI